MLYYSYATCGSDTTAWKTFADTYRFRLEFARGIRLVVVEDTADGFGPYVAKLGPDRQIPQWPVFAPCMQCSPAPAVLGMALQFPFNLYEGYAIDVLKGLVTVTDAEESTAASSTADEASCQRVIRYAMQPICICRGAGCRHT